MSFFKEVLDTTRLDTNGIRIRMPLLEPKAYELGESWAWGVGFNEC